MLNMGLFAPAAMFHERFVTGTLHQVPTTLSTSSFLFPSSSVTPAAFFSEYIPSPVLSSHYHLSNIQSTDLSIGSNMSVPAVLSSLHPEAGPCTVPAIAPLSQIQSSTSLEVTREELLEKNNDDRFLISSPYISPSHLLDLDTISTPNQLMAKALTLLKATRDDYATAPYEDSFNWSEVLDELKRLCEAEGGFHWQEKIFYIVAFRSKIRPTTDRSHLGALDEASHLEATKGGGLLKYWFGEPDAAGRNLATCKCVPAGTIFSAMRLQL